MTTRFRVLAFVVSLVVAAMCASRARRKPAPAALPESVPGDAPAREEAIPVATAEFEAEPACGERAGQRVSRPVVGPPPQEAAEDPWDRLRAEIAEEDRSASSSEATRRAAAEIRVTQEFNETPLPEVISLLQEVTQLNIMIDRRSIEDPESWNLRMSATDLSLCDVLDAMCARLGFGWLVDEGVIVVTTRDRAARVGEDLAREERSVRDRRAVQDELFSRRVTIDADDAPLRAVAVQLAAALGVPFEMESDCWDLETPLTIHEQGTAASSILKFVTGRTGIRAAWRDGRLLFLSPASWKRRD